MARTSWYSVRRRLRPGARPGDRANAKTLEFEPPTRADGEDWVLVVDDAAKAYPVPGS